MQLTSTQADGRLLYVYMKEPTASRGVREPGNRPAYTAPISEPEPAPIPAPDPEPVAIIDESMEVDEVPTDRPAYDERRERESYRRDGRDQRRDYDQRQNYPQPFVQNSRYDYGQPQGPRTGRRDERRDGRFRNEGRMYSDGMMRGGGPRYRS